MRVLDPFCREFLYTHVDKEGLMEGTDMAAIMAVRRATSRRVTAAGGITTQQEIDQLDAAGIDAVAGTVRVDSFVEHPPGARERFVASYLVHADGTHPHVHGTNFGVRGRRYLEAGGWGDHETAEDHDLWNRLRALDGIQLVASDALTVTTSGRVTGRAPRGFADTLRRVCLEAS